MSDRRSFLRGLATLPLIGGSVAILGQPTKADVPVTTHLIDRYVAWLACEHAEALVQRDEIHYPDELGHARFRRDWVHQPLFWFPNDPIARASVLATRPSTRAAIVLSAVGCPLTGGRR